MICNNLEELVAAMHGSFPKLNTVGVKEDNGKLRYDLLIPEFLEEMAKIITYGCSIYGERNWQKVPNGRARFEAACFRHLQEFRKGNILNEETKEDVFYHVAHIAINAMFLYHFEKERQEEQFEQLTLPLK